MKVSTLNHPKLVDLLKMAYSAELAASLAYIGHRKSISQQNIKAEIKQIEDDEWHHRAQVLKILNEYNIAPSKFYEIRFCLIGKAIAWSCFVIGWFMPFYFAGRLESGNVCEYFRMIHYFHELGIYKHDQDLYDMGMKEKEHEIYFYNQVKDSKLLPFFEKIFSWGALQTKNDVLLEQTFLKDADIHCKK